MLLYTIEPYENIFGSTTTYETVYRRVKGGYVELLKTGNGLEVSRVISTDPSVYLNKKLAPGEIYQDPA